MDKEKAKRICINCGSEKYYAKQLCKNCYCKFLRSNFKEPEDFIEFEKSKENLNEIKYKIKALWSILKVNSADLARYCNVSRELVRQWSTGRCKISDNHIQDVFDYLSGLADDARNIINDIG